VSSADEKKNYLESCYAHYHPLFLTFLPQVGSLPASPSNMKLKPGHKRVLAPKNKRLHQNNWLWKPCKNPNLGACKNPNTGSASKSCFRSASRSGALPNLFSKHFALWSAPKSGFSRFTRKNLSLNWKCFRFQIWILNSLIPQSFVLYPSPYYTYLTLTVWIVEDFTFHTTPFKAAPPIPLSSFLPHSKFKTRSGMNMTPKKNKKTIMPHDCHFIWWKIDFLKGIIDFTKYKLEKISQLSSCDCDFQEYFWSHGSRRATLWIRYRFLWN